MSSGAYTKHWEEGGNNAQSLGPTLGPESDLQNRAIRLAPGSDFLIIEPSGQFSVWLTTPLLRGVSRKKGLFCSRFRFDFQTWHLSPLKFKSPRLTRAFGRVPLAFCGS